MALRNGLLVHGPTHWAAAVRDRRGRDQGRLGPQAAAARGRRHPGRARRRAPRRGVRGDPARQARPAGGEAAVPGPGRARASLPARRSAARCCAAALRGAGGEAAAALISFMPALFALRGGELAAYHGVEHKAIGAYEADDEDARRRDEGARALRLAPRRADARLQPRRHAAAAPGRREARRRSPAAPSRSPPSAAAVEVFALVRAQRRDAARRARSGARASRSSAWSAPASPTSASSRSAAPRWRRSCGSRAARPGHSLNGVQTPGASRPRRGHTR